MEMNGGIPEGGAPNTPTGQRRMMETWIVLELCNRGSLQVRLVQMLCLPPSYCSVTLSISKPDLGASEVRA